MLSPKSGIALLLFLPGCMLAAQEPTFRSESNVVLVPALVKGQKGNLVYGLTAKDFIVEDDGIAQKVRLDETVETEPVSLLYRAAVLARN